MQSIFRFIKTAEKISATDLTVLFAEPPGYEKFVQPVSHLLVGSKGSGKSALLRAVSVPIAAARKPLDNLSFVGFYLPFPFAEGDLLTRNYAETGSTDVFDYYFCLRSLSTVLKVMGSEVKLQETGKIFTKRVLSDFLHAGGTLELSAAAALAQKQLRLLRNVLVKRPALTIEELPEFEGAFNSLPSAEWLLCDFSQYLSSRGLPVACLLIDGYDYFCDELRLKVLSLAKKEHPFCVKVAARYIYENPESIFLSMSEWRRDVEILSVDHQPLTEQYTELCSQAANNILSSNGVDVSCDRIFGAGSGTDKRSRYSGLDTFIWLSSGNVKSFLDLCETATDAAGESLYLNLIPAIPVKFQTAAAKKLARQRLIDDLPADAGPSFREVRSFIYWTARTSNELPLDNECHGTTQFMLLGEIVESVASILRTSFKYRHLICSNADFIALNVTPGFLPLKFFLNAGFAPRFDLLPTPEGTYEISGEQVYEFMKKPTTYDPDYEYIPRKPVPIQAIEETLFPQNPPIFISHPLTLKPEQQVLEDKRTKALKRALLPILKKECYDLERVEGLNNETFCVAARDLHRHSAPNFRTEVERIIKRAQYTIHDVTVPAMGVFFELGLAAAYKTPYFLYFNEEDGLWDEFIVKIPSVLSGLDVKVFSKKRIKQSLREWARQSFHSVACNLPSTIRCSFDFLKNSCDVTNIIKKCTQKPTLRSYFVRSL